MITQTMKTFQDGRSDFSLDHTARLTVTVQRQVESDNEEVDDCQGPGTSDSVVRKDVPHDGELGVKRNRRPGERSDQRGEWTFGEDLLDWVKEQLATN
jgi:hypothetical protein